MELETTVQVVEHRVVTCDTMVEGIHWDGSPLRIGWKIVAINASDIGAGVVCQNGDTVPITSSTTPSEWVDEFAKDAAAMNKWNISHRW